MEVTVRRVEASETATIVRILAIHDEMPRVWDPSHRVPNGYLSRLLRDIQSSADAQGFWILDRAGDPASPGVDGLIWAKIMKDPLNGCNVCKINSLWVQPESRNTGLASSLTEACLTWAREQGVTRLECATHYSNSRMREILEKQGFAPGMVAYSMGLD